MIENDFLIHVVDHRLIRNFSRSSHIEIMNTIEILGSSCFRGWNSFSSISFESDSRLKRIEAAALDRLNHRLVLPSTVLFIASDAVHDLFQISLADGDSCPEFGQWQRLRASDAVVDFRRIRRIGSGLGALAEYEHAHPDMLDILRLEASVSVCIEDGLRTLALAAAEIPMLIVYPGATSTWDWPFWSRHA
jgi:hypothetical protein